MQGTQAWYENPDTGVYFSFELTLDDEEPLDHEAESTKPPWAMFNINFCRPCFFAMEAAIELQAFVERFGKEIEDPQVDGNDTGEYVTHRFVSGWNHGNRFGVRGTLSGPTDGQPPVRPHEELERVWCWNSGRARLQEQVGDDVFVPRINYVRRGGEPASATVWSDGIPTLFPETDGVIVYRKELRPRWLFAPKEGQLPFVRWTELRSYDPSSPLTRSGSTLSRTTSCATTYGP